MLLSTSASILNCYENAYGSEQELGKVRAQKLEQKSFKPTAESSHQLGGSDVGGMFHGFAAATGNARSPMGNIRISDGPRARQWTH